MSYYSLIPQTANSVVADQCSSTSNHRLLQRRTKAYQRARRKAIKISHYNIPYENFVGSVLGGRFQLQYLQYQEDHLDIYSVESLSGLWFEAQAFSLCSLPSKLLQARKRRMKRIHQSRNFVCEIEQAGKRFLILDVERSEAEWRNLTHKTDGHISDSMSHESCFADFPDLAGARRRSESFSSVSSDKVPGQDPFDLEKVLINGRIQTHPSPLAHQAVCTHFHAAQATPMLFQRGCIPRDRRTGLLSN